MSACFQFEGQSMLDHGNAVQKAFVGLLTQLRGASAGQASTDPDGTLWALPQWLLDNPRPFLDRLMDEELLARYHRYHDCGKPRCRAVDDAGRQHFPDHARVSAQIWRECGGEEAIAQLIAADMDIHTISAADIDGFSSRPQAASLYLTAWAEIHANATMFGGIESIGFKSKAKHLDRRGRALLKAWEGQSQQASTR